MVVRHVRRRTRGPLVAGQLQVRLVGAGEPVLLQPRVDRFLSSPERVDVGPIGSEASRDLGTLRDSTVARDHTSTWLAASPNRSSAVR